MSKKSQFAALLLIGRISPSKIAQFMEVKHNRVMEYLYRELGAGLIRRSDVVFSIDKETRDAVEEIIACNPGDWDDFSRKYDERKLRSLLSDNVNVEDACVYLRFRDARVPLGDMYEYLARIEVFLHGFIKEKLITAFGNEAWWEQGIPDKIRECCENTMREDSEAAAEPYCYTTLIHLKKILAKQWDRFSPRLPKEVSSEKANFLSDLEALNRLRNVVMHPCKGIHPTEAQFIKVRALMDKLDLRKRELRRSYELALQQFVKLRT